MDDFKVELAQNESMPDARVLTVQGELTIFSAAEFKAALFDALSGAGHVTVDVEHVNGVDLTGLQILCSAHRSATAEGKSISLAGEQSPVFAEAVVLAGFSRSTGCVAEGGNTCIWIGGNR